MELINTILSYITFSGSGLAFLLAVQQITARKRERRNKLRFFHMLHNSLLLLWTGLVGNLVPLAHPAAAFPFLTICFLLGPSNLITNRVMLDNNAPITRKDILHVVPALIVFVAEAAFQMQSGPYKISVIREFTQAPLRSVVSPLVMAAGCHVLAYLVYLMRNELMFWNNDEIKFEARSISVINMIAILSVSCFIAGFFMMNKTVMLLSGSITALIMVSLFILQDYYPEFFLTLKRQINKKRYERSLLMGINTEIIRSRIEELMSDEELFREMELKMPDLAKKLSITTHQLSQYLNEQMKMNFRNFINTYRVREAKKLLSKKCNMNITGICYEVGFNSKSTFNSVFKEATGKTPREFRDEACLQEETTQYME